METSFLDKTTVFWTFYFYLFIDLRRVVAFEKNIAFNKNSPLQNEHFLAKTAPMEDKDISPETSDQVMSAEYMFNVLNKLENGVDVRKVSGFQDADGLLGKADTIRSFSTQAIKFNQMYDVYKFKIHTLSVEEQIKRVELRLRRNSNAIKSNTKVKYVIKHNKKVLLKFHSKEEIKTDVKYSVIDLSKTISPIVNQLHGNITIKISLRRLGGLKTKSVESNDRSESSDNNKDALLILYSEDFNFMQKMYNQFMQKAPVEKHSRSKRAVKQKRKHRKGRRKRKICQLEDFTIDFNHLGWGEWVVYPKDYNAKICTGVCPSPVKDKFTPTNHAMLQSLMRLGQPKIAPMPCCVPSKLKPLKLLYYEKDEIVVRLHEDMVATSCGCR